jgi:hypothetical protein
VTTKKLKESPGTYKGNPETRKKRARAIKPTKKIKNYVCEQIEMGRSLTDICKEEGLPAHRTIHKWVRDDEEFALDYRQARETQMNYLIDVMNDIADLPPPVPPAEVKNEHGKMVPLEGTERKLWVNAVIQQRRLKIDTIKFQAAKLAGVLGANTQAGVMVVGDTVNILNYSTPDEGLPGPEVKAANFIETTAAKEQ